MTSLTSLFGDEADVLRERNFQALLLASVLPPLGLALVSPVLDSLIAPFDTSPANVGLMMSVFTAPAVVMIPVAGVLADRVGRKPILVASLVLFGGSGTAIAATTDFTVVLALRLLQGVAFGGLVPVIITSIGDLYTGDRQATGQGFRFMTAGVSGAAIPIVAGVLVTVGWYYPFLIFALAFPTAVAVALWFDEPTRTPDGRPDGGGKEESYARALLRLLRRRRVVTLVLARTLLTATWIAFLTYNSIVVVRLIGGTPPEAGFLVAAGYFVFAVSASQAGRLTARIDGRLALLVGANLCMGAGFTVTLVAPTVAVATAGVLVLGLGIGLLGSLYRSMIAGLAPDHLRAGLVSVSEMGGQLTNTVTPAAMGAIVVLATPSMGFPSAVRLAGVAVAVTAVVGSVACLLLASTARPIPSETIEDTGI